MKKLFKNNILKYHLTKKKSVTEDKKTKVKKDIIYEDNLKNELNEIMDKYVVEPDLESEEFSKMNEEEQFEFLNKQYIILVRMNNIINEKRSTIYLWLMVYEKFKTSKTNEDTNSDNEISDEDVPAISEDEDDKSDNESVEEVVPKKKKETSKKETLKKDKKYKKDKKSDEDRQKNY